MGAMYRLKAYFGMVPAEELGEYADEPLSDRYAEPRRDRSARDYANDRWDDRFTYEDESDPARRDRYDDEWDRRPARPVAVERSAARGPSGLGSPVRGALAMDPDLQEPLRSVAPAPAAVHDVPEIAVILEGGTVQNVVARNDAPVIVHIVDYDTEGGDETDIEQIPQGEGKTAGAFLQRYDGKLDRNGSAQFWSALAL